MGIVTIFLHLKQRVFLAALAALFLSFSSVAAQAPGRLDTWDVQIWPEYDRPEVLVIMRGDLATDTTFPQRVRVPIPQDATVHAVAYPAEAGNLLTLPWTLENDDQGQSVVFDLDQNSFVVEYYADVIAPPPDRSFDLDLIAPLAAQQATLTLRQPSRASNLQTIPEMTPSGVDDLGNPTYTLDLGALAAGQSVPLQVSYTKNDADPSVSGLAQTAPQAPTGASSAASPQQDWLPLLLGGAIGVLAAAGALYWVRRRQGGASSRQARRREARRKGTADTVRQPAPAGAANRFCPQCGQRFEDSDRFCRNCGAARR